MVWPGLHPCCLEQDYLRPFVSLVHPNRVEYCCVPSIWCVLNGQKLVRLVKLGNALVSAAASSGRNNIAPARPRSH